jgi:hypothetical protein
MSGDATTALAHASCARVCVCSLKVKTANVLLDEGLDAKVADFGTVHVGVGAGDEKTHPAWGRSPERAATCPRHVEEAGRTCRRSVPPPNPPPPPTKNITLVDVRFQEYHMNGHVSEKTVSNKRAVCNHHPLSGLGLHADSV